MNEGDTVVYTIDHYEWLLKANQWPSKHLPRMAHKGIVRQLREEGTAEVFWPTDNAGKGTTKVHFPSNLELLKVPS